MDKREVVVIDSLSKNLKFKVGNNEDKTFVVYLKSDKDQAGELLVEIAGRNAKVQILGLVIGRGNQKINFYSLQRHRQPESVSDLLVKTVLFGESKFYYEGLIKIEKNAFKSNAYQKNQNLLLGQKAWADSRPKLEILANDVRCTHGATIGKIDSDLVYYLNTRGMGKDASERLIIEGFFRDVLVRIPDEKIVEELGSDINKEIGSLLLN